jgi:hypothetical protein
MTGQSEAERDKAVVDAFYQAGIEGHLTSFARYLDPDFKVTADAIIKIVDVWTVRGGKVTSIWVAYFEPQALLDKLGIAHQLAS